MDINILAKAPGTDIYYDPQFRVILEDHMTYLREHPQNILLNVESPYAYKYEGDLFGLLSHYNISFEFHWLIMRVNGYSSPTQTKDTLNRLIIPNTNVITRIRTVYETRSSILD